MAFSTNKSFRGKINDKTAYDYTSQLDYSLNTYEERINLVNKIMEDDYFFSKYFDEFYKVDVNQEDYLSEDINVCKSLEKITNYLLFAPDLMEDEVKGVKYIYTKNKLDERMSKDISLESLTSDGKYEEVIVFLEDISKNYKKEKKQIITQDDYNDPQIGEYLTDCRSAIIKYGKALDSKQIKNYKKIRLVRKFMKEVKSDMILTKDLVKGTIYFKSPLADEGQTDWSFCNFTDKKHVLALLKCPPKNLLHDLGVIVYDLQQLIKNINFTAEENEVLNLYKQEDNTPTKIAKELKLERHIVSGILTRIAKKIIDKYKEEYEEWLLLNYVKGDWKKCSGCGEIKLSKYFWSHPNTKDELYPSCKKCNRN